VLTANRLPSTCCCTPYCSAISYYPAQPASLEASMNLITLFTADAQRTLTVNCCPYFGVFQAVKTKDARKFTLMQHFVIKLDFTFFMVAPSIDNIKFFL